LDRSSQILSKSEEPVKDKLLEYPTGKLQPEVLKIAALSTNPDAVWAMDQVTATEDATQKVTTKLVYQVVNRGISCMLSGLQKTLKESLNYYKFDEMTKGK